MGVLMDNRLNENETLHAQGWVEGQVISALVFSKS